MYILHDRSVDRRVQPLSARWRVRHILVLVFAAARRHSALRAAWVGEHAGRHVVFSKFMFVKTIVYGIISHDSIETKRKST